MNFPVQQPIPEIVYGIAFLGQARLERPGRTFWSIEMARIEIGSKATGEDRKTQRSKVNQISVDESITNIESTEIKISVISTYAGRAFENLDIESYPVEAGQVVAVIEA
jgi:hypothetical protein